jgi:hypothetical protein
VRLKNELVAAGQRHDAARNGNQRSRDRLGGKSANPPRQRKKPEHQVLGPQSTKEGGGDSSYYSECFAALQ